MKSLITVLTIIALVAFFSEYSIAQTNEKVETKMIIIKGSEAWKNTGFLLKSTDRVTITASGRVFFSNGNNLSGVAPKGMKREEYKTNWEFDWQYCNDPLTMANHAALIGKAGNNKFPVGLTKTISGKKGTLFIGINDCTFDGEFYNTGQFKVNIKVYRGK